MLLCHIRAFEPTSSRYWGCQRGRDHRCCYAVLGDDFSSSGLDRVHPCHRSHAIGRYQLRSRRVSDGRDRAASLSADFGTGLKTATTAISTGTADTPRSTAKPDCTAGTTGHRRWRTCFAGAGQIRPIER